MMNYKAVIAGASGLVGNRLLKQLLDQPAYNEILILVRKELNLHHPKLKQLVVDFDRLNDYSDQINGYALFCCLGTTRKKTPDLKVYRKIDHDYPVKLAEIASKNSMAQYHFISSLGANPKSFAFYTKLKGETEDDLKRESLASIFIYRPSLLTGKRQENRLAERITVFLFKLMDPFLLGKMSKYKSIPAETVARAMVNQSLQFKKGIFIFPSEQIKKLA